MSATYLIRRAIGVYEYEELTLTLEDTDPRLKDMISRMCAGDTYSIKTEGANTPAYNPPRAAVPTQAQAEFTGYVDHKAQDDIPTSWKPAAQASPASNRGGSFTYKLPYIKDPGESKGRFEYLRAKGFNYSKDTKMFHGPQELPEFAQFRR